MDVPFVSSGAISRSHYALVRKIETAQTSQLADQYIFAEVDLIHSQLSRSTLTLKQCRECLIILLYCAMNVATEGVVDLEFALYHAVNLAESGPTVQDKRIGYLFCAEAMPSDHELQLMLVNTLRKDLESPELPRICLALDTLIQFSTADVIPAIHTRLADLLSFTSPHVRRRALLAFHKLSKHDTGILSDVIEKVEKRMTDADWVVGSAALNVWVDLFKAGQLSSDRYHQALSALLTSAWRARSEPTKNVLLPKILGCLQLVAPAADDVRTILKVIKSCVAYGPSARAALHASYLTISHASTAVLLPARTTLIDALRPLIASPAPAPNEVYVFVSCLGALDPVLWAGTRADVPAVLEGWEVERVVALLEAEDHTIRLKTMRVLHRVDAAILEAYCTRLLSSAVSPSSADTSETVRRLLELADVLSGVDGEAYAGHVIRICEASEGEAGMPAPLEKRPVVQGVVEGALVKMRDANAEFKSGCVGALFARVPEVEAEVGPTLMVILTALIVEYLPLSPLSPTALLRGLGGRAGSYNVSIQDACLLCMIRLAAECEKVPSEIADAVGRLKETSRAYIRRRCDQFLDLSSRPGTLKEVLADARSPSLPDFAAALETYKPAQAPSSPSYSPRSPPLRPVPHSPDRPSSRASSQGAKLRYDAYDPPRPVQRHFVRRLSAGSDASSRFVGQRGRAVEGQDPLARTMSPGDLALAAGDELETLSVASPRQTPSLPVVNVMDEDNLTTRADLIALDSPFMSEPVASISDVLGHMRDLNVVSEDDFRQEWDGMSDSNARGWCEASPETVVERLQNASGHWNVRFMPAEQEPFPGDTKVLVQAGQASRALLRIKASEDNTSLWHMRCQDAQLRTGIKGILSESEM
ncbi:ARM repeat-containing protein [Fomitopsis serialis]|uniref:ARM repeat-containing protein n=1 Tax=Fomitopsis serialis TaxID=139415 RepID=UPI0020089025|nr:ARM repeat-containing protein [Neoantrodia serialis]KAH9930688.1 ARM repeat-containing protein [Neoantrodia serialis]